MEPIIVATRYGPHEMMTPRETIRKICPARQQVLKSWAMTDELMLGIVNY